MIKVGDQVWWANYRDKGRGEVIALALCDNIAVIRTESNERYVIKAISALMSFADAADDERIRKIVREELSKKSGWH